MHQRALASLNSMPKPSVIFKLTQKFLGFPYFLSLFNHDSIMYTVDMVPEKKQYMSQATGQLHIKCQRVFPHFVVRNTTVQ